MSAAGLRLALGTLTVFPVRVTRVDRGAAGRAMALAPAVGLALGAVAGLPLLLPGPPLLGAALALGLLAVLTRGLHLDGLADLADGLGSGKPAAQALDIMKKSDIGPFGVMAVLFTVLVQAAALTEAGAAGLVTACVAGRLTLAWACRPAVPAARPDGLGAMVAGTVRTGAALLVTLAALVVTAAFAPAAGLVRSWTAPEPSGAFQNLLRYREQLEPGIWEPWPGGLGPPVALLAGLGLAMLLLAHARRRLGGITGDVLGALVETAAAATLVVYVLVV
ncbi:adenosylcobinamide-GDP ribazoletransferase [Nonomuraea harbinensis]|uniref:Adenosylcobinamide-GDP ribazoletransferase n=1 Tax=Nonomuraea harbinensis TaxID=1286938 RepID=A0ABW1BST4_9ACTN|nr:adenosylcobinamide-GDP ribazoletransferase [Nonomuraea harbinensis]